MPRVARLPQIPYLATNISAASDGVCARTKAVYTSTLWFRQELLIFFVLWYFYRELRTKRDGDPVV